jgi:hypothetical protein
VHTYKHHSISLALTAVVATKKAAQSASEATAMAAGAKKKLEAGDLAGASALAAKAAKAAGETVASKIKALAIDAGKLVVSKSEAGGAAPEVPPADDAGGGKEART